MYVKKWASNEKMKELKEMKNLLNKMGLEGLSALSVILDVITDHKYWWAERLGNNLCIRFTACDL